MSAEILKGFSGETIRIRLNWKKVDNHPISLKVPRNPAAYVRQIQEQSAGSLVFSESFIESFDELA